MEQYQDYLHRLWPNSKILNVTFQVTDDCTCDCSYCYQINKGHHQMTKEIAKKCIDQIFTLEADGLIIELIGGEPLMNIEVVEYICDTFLKEAIKRHSPWVEKIRFVISSNGTFFNTPQVQNFISKYKDFLSLGVTVDGPKEIHNLCRLKKNGGGSFDEAFAAWQQTDKFTKITVAPENLSQIGNIAQFFVDNNASFIGMNPAYEPKWTIKQGIEYYYQLKQIADIFLKNPIDNNIFILEHFKPIEHDLRTWCGGYGEMIAFDPQGIIYPCLRFMPSSLGEQTPPLIIGNCEQGLWITEKQQKIQQQLESVNRRTENDDICFYCPIGAGCGECAAWSYQSSGGVIGKRNTNICNMHKGAYLGNVYYWSQLGYKFNHPTFLEKEWNNVINELNWVK